MTAPVHMSTDCGNPVCGLRDHCARLTGTPGLVTCPDCRESHAHKSRLRKAATAPMSGALHPAARRIRASANAYLRRALKLIEELPIGGAA